MEKEYLKKLISQYQMATGTVNVDLSSESFLNELCEWIVRNKVISDEYLDFLSAMTRCDNGLEIGKGVYDTVFSGTSVPLITPYMYGLQNSKDREIIPARFEVIDCQPSIITCDTQPQVYSCSDIDYIRYMTQNPYSPDDIRNWHQLHNSGYPITAGVYGKIYDKDKEEKLMLIKSLASRLFGQDYYCEYDTNNDSYYYVVSSNGKLEKVKTLELTR